MIGWIDASCGASGDMLLGALVDAGVPLAVLQDAIAATGLPISLRAVPATRGGLACLRIQVETTEKTPVRRTWSDLRELGGDLPAFTALAHAEAAVHGTEPGQVHFHEVGALDAVADVVGATAGFRWLGLTALHCSPVALGGGSAPGEHGVLAVPVPAVVALLAGAPVHGGPIDVELCTPTGAALLATHVTQWGQLPPMRINAVGAGGGSRDFADRPNVLRLILGEPTVTAATGPEGSPGWWLVACNVDDLEPRLWPGVLDRLLAAGAADAWLTPILMKKGRPAHTLTALVTEAHRAAVRLVVFTETTSIGLRETAIDSRVCLDRRVEVLDVDGHRIRVKVATLDGRDITRTPEWEDVAATAMALGLPAKDVLARAISKLGQWGSPNS